MSDKTSVAVWDVLVRVFHWSLVLSFVVAYISSEGGGELHEVTGYIVLGLISFRVIWGFIGSKHARFTDFIYSPKQVMEYVRSLRAGSPKHYLGHNPLDGWMVVALLVMLFVVTLSGLQLEEIKESQTPVTQLADSLNALGTAVNHAVESGSLENIKEDMDSPAEKFWEEFHETATNIMLLLIALHILGVISSSRQHKENLVKAMITGKKEQNG